RPNVASAKGARTGGASTAGARREGHRSRSANGRATREAQKRRRRQGAGFDHRSGGAHHEDGRRGFRPAYHGQKATEAESGIILNMDVTNEGSDEGQMKPMMDEIKNDLGQAPNNLLTDGGFSTIDDIEETTQAGTTVYTPVKEEEKQKKAGKDPFTPKPADSPIIAEWRQRMGTEAAQQLYKVRAPTAELSNARLRNQGIYQMRVRGLAKVKAALWWHMLAVNLLRAAVLRAAARSNSRETPCAQAN